MQKRKMRHTWERTSTSYWFFPIVMLSLGIILGRIMLRVDDWLPNTLQFPRFLFTGSAADARNVLISLAGTILATASVVFSLQTVPLSVAASQFGSRLLRLYLRDNRTQFILGLFVGTFSYLVSVGMAIPDIALQPEAPQISASLGILLCFISFGSIIVLIHHIGTSLQAPNMVASAGADLLRAIDVYNDEFKLQTEMDIPQIQAPDMNSVTQTSYQIYASRKGYIQHIDPNIVLPLAEKYDLTIHIVRKAGHFIQHGDLLASVFPSENINDGIVDQICSAYKLGNQRTPTQDLVYAVNQLVEVAVRAMSPAINDPYTAITCLDHIGAGLSIYIDDITSRVYQYYDQSGRLRLIFDPVTFTELLDAAFNLLRRASRENADVLLAMLKTIEKIAGRITRTELRAEMIRHVKLVEAECRASSAIDWDKERIIHSCADLILYLETSATIASQFAVEK